MRTRREEGRAKMHAKKEGERRKEQRGADKRRETEREEIQRLLYLTERKDYYQDHPKSRGKERKKENSMRRTTRRKYDGGAGKQGRRQFLCTDAFISSDRHAYRCGSV